MTLKEGILSEAMKLPVEERLPLAEDLLESADAPADPDAEQAWAEEIKRRVDAVDRGEAKFIPWEDAR